jgi:hypothetical protein
MKHRFFRVFPPVLFFALVLAASRDWDTTSGCKTVEYDLQGPWKRTEAAFWPEGQTTT